MSRLQGLAPVRLALWITLTGSLVNLVALPTRSQEIKELGELTIGSQNNEAKDFSDHPQTTLKSAKPSSVSVSVPSSPVTLPLSDVGQPATTVKDWMAQVEASLVQISGVRVKTTEMGVQVLLDAEGALAEPVTRVEGNTLIAEIANATLAEPFSQANPAVGIEQVSVTPLAGDRVQVEIVGTDTPPVAEVSLVETGLMLVVMTGSAEVAEDEEIEITVTAEQQDEAYNPSSASTATKTDTPLRDIPQSIQVVPQKVIEDRSVRTVNDAIETVPGVIDGGDTIFRIFRGFSTTETSQLRNGNRTGDTYALIPEEPAVSIDRLEILKGPASVLFGALEPGGVINAVTKQPLSEPYYKLGLKVGNRGFYQPSIDLSGPVTTDKTALYRLIAAYDTFDGYFNGGDRENIFVGPSITLNFGDNTSLDLYYEYSRYAGDLYGGLYTVARSDGSLLPRDVNVWGNPDLTFEVRQSHEYGFKLEHDFNDNVKLSTSFSANNFNVPNQRFAVPIGLQDDRFVEFFLSTGQKR